MKSLPSGVLQDRPDGTQVSVQDAATGMISISDNTTTDMLIHQLGRTAVEAELHAAGMADPSRNEPFLTTRETFILALQQWPTLAERYTAADPAGRRKLLDTVVDRAPLPSREAAQALSSRHAGDAIGWFASAANICRAYLRLADLAAQPGLAPIADVLQLNDGGLQLDPNQWRRTWFKGGVGSGVLASAYLATTQADGAAAPRARPRPSVTARPAQAYPLQGAALAAVWPRRGDPGRAMEILALIPDVGELRNDDRATTALCGLGAVWLGGGAAADRCGSRRARTGPREVGGGRREPPRLLPCAMGHQPRGGGCRPAARSVGGTPRVPRVAVGRRQQPCAPGRGASSLQRPRPD